MACNYPITAYRCEDGSVVFDERKGAVVSELRLPCGQCDGCRLERSRQWAVRCMHEASLYEDNCFVTLTYNDEHVPMYNDLVYDDFQRFMKRLRKKAGRKLRFFMCGEYGEKNGRPHFHSCIFNYNFSDRVEFGRNKNGDKTYTSKTLDALWSDRAGNALGFCIIGNVDFASAAYVARYVMKKRMGRHASLGYQDIDIETGEVYQRQPEFCHMSLKPGIGRGFYDKWRSDMFPRDVCVVNGVATKPPKYYTKILAKEHENVYALVQESRAARALASAADNIQSRLEVKEEVLKARIKSLKRTL